KLAPGLDGEALRYALHLVRDRLQPLQAVYVVLEDLTPRAGARRRQRVGRVHQDRLDRGRIVVTVVALHGVDDLALLAVLVEHLPSELEMRPFHLAVDGLADIVQQPAA